MTNNAPNVPYSYNMPYVFAAIAKRIFSLIACLEQASGKCIL